MQLHNTAINPSNNKRIVIMTTFIYKWHQYKRYICLFAFIIFSLKVAEEAFLLYVEKWQLKTKLPPLRGLNRVFMMINFALQGCNLRLKSTSSCVVIYGWPRGCAIITNGKKDNAIRFSSTPCEAVQFQYAWLYLVDAWGCVPTCFL